MFAAYVLIGLIYAGIMIGEHGWTGFVDFVWMVFTWPLIAAGWLMLQVARGIYWLDHRYRD